MIYKNLLYEISKGQNGSSNPEAIEMNVPSNAHLYQVDLNTRTIEAPKYLSVQQEHRAETVYFVVDRYYGNMDLSLTTCVVNFINANNEGYVYFIPYCDVYMFDGKIILPWNISGAATKKAGIVSYSLMFYLMEDLPAADELDTAEGLGKITYRLSTQMAQSEVMYGMDLEEVANDETFGFESNLEQLHTLLASIGQSFEEAIVYWTDVT